MSSIKINRKDIKIVKEEIESWYIAGASDNFLRRYHIKIGTNTESIKKEKLYSYIPIKMEKTMFMLQILEDFSISEAIRRNHSFGYLLKSLEQ